MNKFGIVCGVAAVVTLAGCKDPDYKHGASTFGSQNEPVSVETAPVAEKPAAVEVKPVESAPVVTEVKPVVKPVSKPVAKPAPKPVPAEPEYTVYIVQSGDYLAKISRRFNVTISSIERINGIKNGKIRIGQKLKLPGKIDVGVQSAPAARTPAAAKAPKGRKGYAAYRGATKEYVVQNGDSLGKIAYSNGINIRQLKELNGLKKDFVRVGMKLKIPAEKVVAKSAEKKPEEKKPAEAAASAPAAGNAPVENATAATEPAVAPAATAPAATEPAAAPAENAPAAEGAPAAENAPAAAPAAPATTPYVVQETDDLTGLAIRFGTSAAEIRELNNLGENEQLTPGKTIKLPAEQQ